MNELKDQVVVFGGGTGSVSEGMVRTLLEEGARVVVPCRSAEKRQRLEKYVADLQGAELLCLDANVGDEASVQAFRNDLRSRVDRIDLGIACLGGWYYGYSLHRMPFADWQRVLLNNLTTHFLFMRAILSLMHDQNHGTYVMINGGASEVIAPESGMISIVAAAQRMMTRVLAEEARGKDVRVYSVVAFDAVKTRDRRGEVLDEWLSPEDVAHYVTDLHTGRASHLEQPIHTLHTRDDVHWAPAS